MKKNVILKIPSESITRMPKESLMGKKKMICPRIFLPYEILPLLERKLPIYCTFYLEKKVFKNFMYWILGQIIFFFPTKDSIGMLVMDFEGIFEITFFFHLISTQHSVCLPFLTFWIIQWTQLLGKPKLVCQKKVTARNS